MAAKIRGLGRLLITLTLMGWGFSAFAEDFYWSAFDTTRHSAIAPACNHAGRSWTESSGYNLLSVSFVIVSEVQAQCIITYNFRGGASVVKTNIYANRHGTSCPGNAPYDPAAGACLITQNCADTAGQKVTAAQVCDFVPALKMYVCEDSVSQNGCRFISDGKRNCVADLVSGKGICSGDFFGEGSTAGTGADECGEGQCTAPADPSAPPADEQCVTNGDITICHKPSDPGCGSVNGKEGCFQEQPGCGYFNGEYQCVDADKPNRNCGYYNGKLTCTDPKDPTKIIPESSPDHPKNGGNADGNPNNDPKAPGQLDPGPQDGDGGATNEAIGNLGDRLGGKLDSTNSLLGNIKGALDGISGKIDGLLDGLTGGDYDGSGDGNGATIGGIGSGAGSELVTGIGQQLEESKAVESASDKISLDSLPDEFDGVNFFGEESKAAQVLNFVSDLLPSSTGCVNYTIPFSLGRYSTSLIIPTCALASLKPLLEWVIWVITAIGLWNILYSTLRM